MAAPSPFGRARSARRRLAVLGCAVLVAASAAWAWRGSGAKPIPVAQLPAEARHTLAVIERGGPFPYRRDGVVFHNYERRLPLRERDYYHEYTVPTPGLDYRGARRLIVGCEPGERTRPARRAGPGTMMLPHCAGPATVYYTNDHYRTFRRVVP